MNQELQQAIQELIEKSSSAVGTGFSFIEGELPEYISQLLLWYSLSGFLLFCLGVILAIVAIYADVRLYKYSKEKDNSDIWFGYFVLGSAVRVIVLCLVLSFISRFEWLQILIAPNVWLVEYATGLLK
jgi:hypothetical protein